MAKIVKNSFGISVVYPSQHLDALDLERSIFSGSSLDRLKSVKKKPRNNKKTEPKPRSMSQRTKSKIRKKIMAFAQLHKRLTLVTFTFVNEVEDQQAVQILRRFLDNMKKRKKGFEYLWVAEKQNKNTVFPGNIHFHMITNSYFKVEKTWKYWLELQKKHGVVPRDENFKPSSALDIKAVNTKNPRSLSQYLTKYISKNKDKFMCQVWQCSKGISRLYTDFYSNRELLNNLITMKGSQVRQYDKDYCSVYIVPIDKETLRLYEVLKQKNEENST